MNSEKKDLSQVLSKQFAQETFYEPKAHGKEYSEKLKWAVGAALSGLLLAMVIIEPTLANPIYSKLGIDYGQMTFIVGLLLVLLATSDDF